MRKIITAVVLVALLFAGAFYLSEKVFKQPSNKVAGVAFMMVDGQGQKTLDVELYRDNDKAVVYAGGSLLGGQDYEAQANITLLDSAEDLVEKLNVAQWKSFSTEPVDVPAGQFGVLITYADGSCISANSEGLSAETTQKAINTVTKWVSDLISNRLGMSGNPLLDLLGL